MRRPSRTQLIFLLHRRPPVSVETQQEQQMRPSVRPSAPLKPMRRVRVSSLISLSSCFGIRKERTRVLSLSLSVQSSPDVEWERVEGRIQFGLAMHPHGIIVSWKERGERGEREREHRKRINISETTHMYRASFLLFDPAEAIFLWVDKRTKIKPGLLSLVISRVPCCVTMELTRVCCCCCCYSREVRASTEIEADPTTLHTLCVCLLNRGLI